MSQIANSGSLNQSAGDKPVVIPHGTLIAKLVQNRLQTPPIPLIRYSAPVVDLPNQMAQSVPRNIRESFQHCFQTAQRSVQVALVELIVTVESDWPEFTTFQHHRVEQTDAESQFVIIVTFLIFDVHSIFS